MRTNRTAVGPDLHTHEGAPATRITPLAELRRSALTALLWENGFYETGSEHATRVAALVPTVAVPEVAALAREARTRMHLRHLPLFLARELARVKGAGSVVADLLADIIQRPDELTEYLALYWRGAKTDAEKDALSAGSKRGLRRAFAKFSEYALAKYDRDTVVKLRDVLRLAHPKPKDAEQAALWKRVVARELATPDTWEVALSAGGDKHDVFERLLREQKLGALAFLRNLRNIVEANVSADLVRARFAGTLDKVLPFRFIAAARHAPAYAQELNDAMLRAVADEPRLPGLTIVLVDVSGSMRMPLSAKSEMRQLDAGAGLAVLVRELGTCRIFSFSDRLVEVPSYRGLPLVDAIQHSQANCGTALGAAVREVEFLVPSADRLIVITDEQSHDRVPDPTMKGYMINVAANQHGVGYGPWTHVDGWSERVLDFVREVETS